VRPPGAISPMGGKFRGGRGEIYLVAKSRGPKSNAVAYAERALSTKGVSTSAPATSLLVDQSSPNFLPQCGRDGSRSSLLSIFSTSIHTRCIRGQSFKLP